MIEAKDIEVLRLQPGDLIHVSLNADDATEEELSMLAAVGLAHAWVFHVAVLISDGSITLKLVRPEPAGDDLDHGHSA